MRESPREAVPARGRSGGRQRMVPIKRAHGGKHTARAHEQRRAAAAGRVVRGPGRKYGTPLSGWQQQLVSQIGVPDHARERSAGGLRHRLSVLIDRLPIFA